MSSILAYDTCEQVCTQHSSLRRAVQTLLLATVSRVSAADDGDLAEVHAPALLRALLLFHASDATLQVDFLTAHAKHSATPHHRHTTILPAPLTPLTQT